MHGLNVAAGNVVRLLCRYSPPVFGRLGIRRFRTIRSQFRSKPGVLEAAFHSPAANGVLRRSPQRDRMLPAYFFDSILNPSPTRSATGSLPRLRFRRGEDRHWQPVAGSETQDFRTDTLAFAPL